MGKGREKRELEMISWLEKHGIAVTLPSGTVARVHKADAAIFGCRVSLKSSGRLRAHELAGARVVLTKADRGALRSVLARALALEVPHG